MAAMLLTGCHSTGPQPIPDRPTCKPCSEILGNLDDSGSDEGFQCALDIGPATLAKGPFPQLVFEGGGVKGIAYAGVLEVLEGADLMDDVEAVAGASAGSIVSLAVALGYTAEEVQRLLLHLDFQDFEDSYFPKTVENLYEEYGLYPGDYALCFLDCLVTEKGLPEDATFAELHRRRQEDPAFKDLYVVATDVRGHTSVTFSHETHPDLPVSHAARMSMSFPYFFAATEYDGRIFVDGGVVDNYPLNVFDDRPENGVLGFHLGTAPAEGDPIDNVVDYTKEMFTTVLDVQIDAFCASPRDVRRSVIINPMGIPTLDFSLTREQKCELVRSGASATQAWLAEAEPSSTCPTWLLELLPPDGLTSLRSPNAASTPRPNAAALEASPAARADASAAVVVDLPNARRPLPGVLTGGQPSAKDLAVAAEAGYRTVIDLRTPGEFEDFDEAALVRALGMEYVSIPVAGAEGLTRDNAEALAAALEGTGDAPVLVHCGSGNRVGALLAVGAHWGDGRSVEEALALGREAGLTRLESAVEELLATSEGGGG